MSENTQILIYGYGNPGRKDDGLGCRFVELFSEWSSQNDIENIEFDCNYQLNIEDAHHISEKDLVIFVDASTENISDFLLTRVDESSDISFTSHEASPGYIYHLCTKLFDKRPNTFLLHIKGYEWNFEEGLSDLAFNNLKMSIEYMKSIFITKTNIIDNILNITIK